MGHQLHEILNSVPAKASRSRLEPYSELIRELRLPGQSYRDIVTLLATRCGLRISVSTLYEFVRRRDQNVRRPDEFRKYMAYVARQSTPLS